MTLSKSERVLRARFAAFTMHSRNDPRRVTAQARIAFMQRFEDEVDPDKKLSTSERERRALAARKAYFTRLAYLSVKKRRRKRT